MLSTFGIQYINMEFNNSHYNLLVDKIEEYNILLKSTMKKQNQLEGNDDQHINCNSLFQYDQIEMIARRKRLFMDLITTQNELNRQLIINAGLLNSYLTAKKISTIKVSSSDTSTNPSSNKNSNMEKNEKRPPKQKTIQAKQKTKEMKKKRKKVQDSSYEPQQSQPNQITSHKLSQTKNVPKNFGKAILAFIRKEKTLTERVLAHYQICQTDFYSLLEKYKGKINTIAQLRSLWITEENLYAKPLRILSMEYLRKYSLSHIFNSRVENYDKHVKYRYKIAKGMENPYQFTQIKDF